MSVRQTPRERALFASAQARNDLSQALTDLEQCYSLPYASRGAAWARVMECVKIAAERADDVAGMTPPVEAKV